MTNTQALPIGTVVVNTWGYDQTNVDFYEVVKASSQFVTLRELKSTTTESSPLSMSGTTVPQIDGEDRYTSEETSRRKVVDGRVNFEFGGGKVWDGKPQRCSWYA